MRRDEIEILETKKNSKKITKKIIYKKNIRVYRRKKHKTQRITKI